jgi:hypothetical protein
MARRPVPGQMDLFDMFSGPASRPPAPPVRAGVPAVLARPGVPAVPEPPAMLARPPAAPTVSVRLSPPQPLSPELVPGGLPGRPAQPSLPPPAAPQAAPRQGFNVTGGRQPSMPGSAPSSAVAAEAAAPAAAEATAQTSAGAARGFLGRMAIRAGSGMRAAANKAGNVGAGIIAGDLVMELGNQLNEQNKPDSWLSRRVRGATDSFTGAFPETAASIDRTQKSAGEILQGANDWIYQKTGFGGFDVPNKRVPTLTGHLLGLEGGGETVPKLPVEPMLPVTDASGDRGPLGGDMTLDELNRFIASNGRIKPELPRIGDQLPAMPATTGVQVDPAEALRRQLLEEYGRNALENYRYWNSIPGVQTEPILNAQAAARAGLARAAGLLGEGSMVPIEQARGLAQADLFGAQAAAARDEIGSDRAIMTDMLSRPNGQQALAMMAASGQLKTPFEQLPADLRKEVLSQTPGAEALVQQMMGQVDESGQQAKPDVQQLSEVVKILESMKQRMRPEDFRRAYGLTQDWTNSNMSFLEDDAKSPWFPGQRIGVMRDSLKRIGVQAPAGF